MNTPKQPIVIGILTERSARERRVALIPVDIKKLNGAAAFLIESGAGQESGFSDNAYLSAGARIAASREILENCDLIVKVRAPRVDEVPRAGSILVSLGGHDLDLGERLRQRSVKPRSGNGRSLLPGIHRGLCVTVGGVLVMGPTDLPSLMATDASRMFSGNIRALIAYLLDGSGRLNLDASDPISGALLAGQTLAHAHGVAA
jgi:NAD/NADP transhydrogenase alpha subunit